MDEKKEFTFEIEEAFGDNIVEEGGNTSTNIRKISWNGKPHKIDIRKYFYKNGQEFMTKKGVSLSETGANEVASVLVEKGYGDTVRLVKALRSRENFSEAMLSGEGLEQEAPFFSPENLLKPAGDAGSNVGN